MRYFVNPSNVAIQTAMSAGLLDCIVTPKQGNGLPALATWCADNGCFGNGYPGDAAWFAWLADRDAHHLDRCAFAVAPDVVGDAAATLERSSAWLRPVRALGYPVALVAQNGLERLSVPWADFDVLFIGGSLECTTCGYVQLGDERGRHCPRCAQPLHEWKLGAAVRTLVAQARWQHGKVVHMGRVNSRRRLRYAAQIGCHSADGTCMKRAPDKYLPRFLQWLDEVNTEMAGFDAVRSGAPVPTAV